MKSENISLKIPFFNVIWPIKLNRIDKNGQTLHWHSAHSIFLMSQSHNNKWLAYNSSTGPPQRVLNIKSYISSICIKKVFFVVSPTKATGQDSFISFLNELTLFDNSHKFLCHLQHLLNFNWSVFHAISNYTFFS